MSTGGIHRPGGRPHDRGEGRNGRTPSGEPRAESEDELADHARRTTTEPDRALGDDDLALTDVLRRIAESARTLQEWLKASDTVTLALRSPHGDDPLQLIAAGVAECTRADVVAVLRPSGAALRVDAVAGTRAADVLGRLLPLHGSPAGSVLSTGAPQRHTGAAAERHGPRQPVTPALGTGPFMIVPLGSPSRVTGVVVIVVAPGGTTAFTSEELDLATRLAHRASLALEIAQTGPGRRRTAMEAEQEQVTEEFHRGAVQRLFGLGLSLHGLAASLGPGRRDRVLATVDLVDAAINRIRTSAFDPDAVPGTGARS